MAAGYELWSMSSGNLLDDFETEDEALATIGELIVMNGPGTTDQLALTHVDDEGQSRTVALGSALEQLVQSKVFDPARRLS